MQLMLPTSSFRFLPALATVHLLLQLSIGCAQDADGIPSAERAALTARRDTLKPAVAKTPAAVGLYSQLGDAHLFLHEFRESVAAFEKMIELDPTQDAPHWRLGIAYYFAGDFEKSAKQFEKYQTYESGDRENGIWKFLADARSQGVEKARGMMLKFTRFDREPFPVLYEMFEGKKTSDDVIGHVAEKKLTDNPQVVFFAHYYVGLNEHLQGNRDRALDHLRKAVALFTPETASSGGPGYMWRVARVHLQETGKR
jgi:lipoprotein NlpI